MKIKSLIKKLDLKPLEIEGGFYVETYRSNDFFVAQRRKKRLSTAIYYLLRKGDVCKIHRLKSDEIWHHYVGDSVNIYFFYQDGRFEKKVLGKKVLKDEYPQLLIPKNTFFSAKLKKGGKFALLGTTVSPAFEFEDFELPKREDLLKQFPSQKKIILRLIG